MEATVMGYIRVILTPFPKNPRMQIRPTMSHKDCTVTITYIGPFGSLGLNHKDRIRRKEG